MSSLTLSRPSSYKSAQLYVALANNHAVLYEYVPLPSPCSERDFTLLSLSLPANVSVVAIGCSSEALPPLLKAHGFLAALTHVTWSTNEGAAEEDVKIAATKNGVALSVVVSPTPLLLTGSHLPIYTCFSYTFFASSQQHLSTQLKELVQAIKNEDETVCTFNQVNINNHDNVQAFMDNDNEFLLYLKAQSKITNKNNLLPPLFFNEIALPLNIEFSLSPSTTSSSTACTSPILRYTQQVKRIDLLLEVVSFTSVDSSIVHVRQQIVSKLQHIIEEFASQINNYYAKSPSHFVLHSHIYKPYSMNVPLNIHYIMKHQQNRYDAAKLQCAQLDKQWKTINIDEEIGKKTLELDENEAELTPVRANLHRVFSLASTRPFFRVSNALHMRSSHCFNAYNMIVQPRLISPHLQMQYQPVGTVSCVQGPYAYYHYLQDHEQDNGWGCAYRTLQSVMSWFILNGYCARTVPSIQQIQQTLVDIGDKTPRFVNSREWIGAIEVGMLMNVLFGIECKTLFVASGSDVTSYVRELAAHFNTNGTPIMIGGGVLAYGLLGVDHNEKSGDVRFLILDPHYTGGEQLNNIFKGAWIGWKKPDLFLPEHFYNFCLPQRPQQL